MGLSNPPINNGEQPAKDNPPQNINGSIIKLLLVISNNTGNNNIQIIKQYPVNQYRLSPPNK